MEKLSPLELKENKKRAKSSLFLHRKGKNAKTIYVGGLKNYDFCNKLLCQYSKARKCC